MKRRYEEMILECILLSAEDILTLSEGDDLGGGFDTPYDPF